MIGTLLELSQACEIAALKARIAELEVKARRYDWLRRGDNDERVIEGPNRYKGDCWLPRLGELDALIDKWIAYDEQAEANTRAVDWPQR